MPPFIPSFPTSYVMPFSRAVAFPFMSLRRARLAAILITPKDEVASRVLGSRAPVCRHRKPGDRRLARSKVQSSFVCVTPFLFLTFTPLSVPRVVACIQAFMPLHLCTSLALHLVLHTDSHTIPENERTVQIISYSVRSQPATSCV